MNYPIWNIPVLGGSIVIAIISILHVFIAHFAVGGGLFLVLTERKAYRENDPRIIEYLKKHTKFFVLLSLVLGAVLGVGIWFAIGLVSPEGTVSLIRIFVWVWAMEYIPFFVEIVAAMIYHYGWNRLDRRTHLLVGGIYFTAAWSSLFFINGILTFMLTPGQWVNTFRLWDGFFNPTMWPSLFMRTFVAFALAGLYGLVTSSWIKEEEVRNKMIRYSAKWLWPAYAGIPLSGVWYFAKLPDYARHEVFGGAPAVMVFLLISVIFSILILVFSYFGPFREPKRFSFTLSLLFLIMGLTVTGSSEWVREAIRKPYVISNYLYSNGIRPDQRSQINRQGILQTAKWAHIRQITPDNRIAAGREIFRLQCLACHAIEGYNGVKPMVERWDERYLDYQLQHLNVLKGFMPPFMGTEEERKALAAYLVTLKDKQWKQLKDGVQR